MRGVHTHFYKSWLKVKLSQTSSQSCEYDLELSCTKNARSFLPFLKMSCFTSCCEFSVEELYDCWLVVLPFVNDCL